ncbi:MAG: DUF5615 family PIN-like protein [Actinomycetota bacterium]
MKLKFVADENIPLEAVKRIRDNKIRVISITEIGAGFSDTKVADIANKQKAYIITFDKDFGELIYRKKLKVHGIILLRIQPCSPDYVEKKLTRVIGLIGKKPDNNFIIVEDDKIRIRKLKQ